VAGLGNELAMLIEQPTPLIHRQCIKRGNVVHLALFHPQPVLLLVMPHLMNRLCIFKASSLAATIHHTLSRSLSLEQNRVHARRVYPSLLEAHLLATYLHRCNTDKGMERAC